MSDPAQFVMHEHGNYRLDEFDALLMVLDEIPDAVLREEIRDEVIDCQLDVEALAAV